jgi:hypothetical protein
MKPLRLVSIILCAIAVNLLTSASIFSQTLTYYQASEIYGSNPAGNQLVVRMNGLHASIKADNTGGAAKTYTVTIKNVDPDFVMLSEGTTTAKGANTLTFTWNIAAGATHTVWINPWYLTPTDFYFIAWADNQHQPVRFQRLLAKASLINPVLSVGGGDCIKHGDDGGCVGSGGRPEPATDAMYLSYVQLYNDYPTPVFQALGNHDITRGGWTNLDDSNYGAGERLWRKYLGPTDYGFTVHPTDPSGGIHFLITRFYYDMPNWNSRYYFGGCTPDGFLRFDNNDSVGVAISSFIRNDLAAAQTAAARISVTHHGFDMFLADKNTVANARELYQTGKVSYMIDGHKHIYSTGTDAPTQIPYLTTGDANGDANAGNPGFSLMRVNNGKITEQHMLADNLALNINYTANGTSLTQGKATITCSGYNLPYVRLKFKLSNTYAAYQAKDVATGANLPSYSHKFSDYTVVYVETGINNGATKNIQLDPIIQAAKISTTNTEQENADKSVTIFPNPAKTTATIHLPTTGKQASYHIVLYDMSGKAVRVVKSAAQSVVLQLEGLSQGTYLVKISTGNKHLTTKRLVVE